ncbi:MAG: serine/threonine protein kinase, partial [Caldimonas sp.]
MSNDDDQPTRILPPQAPKTPVAPQPTEFAPPPEPFAPDGDATVIKPRPARVPTNDGGNMLPVGYYLGEFEITKVLGEGGFGIVYLAEDHSLGRRVALKEYMPSSLAQRVGGTQVSVKSERHRETFEAGRKSFVNEARLLAQFDHPSLVKVYRFWEANGTAYMVMPFYEGVTLKDELKAMGAP